MRLVRVAVALVLTLPLAAGCSSTTPEVETAGIGERKLTVEPAGPYAEGQQATVSAVGFPPGLTVMLAVCEQDWSGSPKECASPSTGASVTTPVDETWRVSARLTLHSQLRTPSGRTITCPACKFVAFDVDAPIVHSTAPLVMTAATGASG